MRESHTSHLKFLEGNRVKDRNNLLLSIFICNLINSRVARVQLHKVVIYKSHSNREPGDLILMRREKNPMMSTSVPQVITKQFMSYLINNGARFLNGTLMQT